MYDIITVGSSTVDVFVNTDSELIKIKTAKSEEELIAYPAGTKLIIKDLNFTIGGGGTNTAVAFSRLGFKVGYLIDSKQKYIGNRPEDYKNVKTKTKDINRLQEWTYGPTLRVGFKYVSLYGYYQLSNIFDRGFGPEMYPISVGLTISPF